MSQRKPKSSPRPMRTGASTGDEPSPPADRASSRHASAPTAAVPNLGGLRVVPPKAPGLAALRQIADELRTYDHVVGVLVGHKETAGRRTRTLSVVCLVDEKLPKADVGEGHLVPREIEWGPRDYRSTIPTDVVAVGVGALHAGPVLGPGDAITDLVGPFGNKQEPLIGTLGVAMAHPTFGPVVTTAAHVLGMTTPGTAVFHEGGRPRLGMASGAGSPVGAQFTGEVVKASLSSDADYALINASGMAAGPEGNVFQDIYALGAPVIPGPNDVPKTLAVLTSTGARKTILRFVGGPAPVGPIVMRNVLLTDWVTNPGDSGAALVGADLRVWGLLDGFTTLGRTRYSVFTPAWVPFWLEGASFF